MKLKNGQENLRNHYAASVVFQTSRFCCVDPRLHCQADLLAVLLQFFTALFQLLTVILNLGQGVWPPNLGILT